MPTWDREAKRAAAQEYGKVHWRRYWARRRMGVALFWTVVVGIVVAAILPDLLTPELVQALIWIGVVVVSVVLLALIVPRLGNRKYARYRRRL